MRLTPATELEYRCHKLQQLMALHNLDAVIVLHNADLFYFTGSVQRGCLYVPASGQPLYLVHKDFMRARMESGLKEVIPLQPDESLSAVIAHHGYPQPARIGMELDVIPVTLFDSYRSTFSQSLFDNASPLIRQIRMIKSHYEIHLLQDAADQADRVYRRAHEIIRAGMTDVDLAAELEALARKEGHQGFIRMRGFNSEQLGCNVFSGTDAAAPSYGESPLGGMGLNPSFGQGSGLKQITAHEPITIDFTACVDGYQVQQSRVFAIGTISPLLAKAFEDMCAVQQVITDSAKVGGSWSELYKTGLATAHSLGCADNFMGGRGSQNTWIGHGIGIESNEYPMVAMEPTEKTFETGMTLVLEPTLCFPGIGAIGVKNTYYFSNDGLKRLSRSPDNLIVLGV